MPTATQSPPAPLTDAELAAMRAEAEQLVVDLGTINYEHANKLRRVRALMAVLPKEYSANLVIPDARPVWGPCTRCGHQWRGHSLNPPRACSRCGSSGWQFESRYKNARKPSDPPNPYWQKHHRKERIQLSQLTNNLVRIGNRPVKKAPPEVVFPPPLPTPEPVKLVSGLSITPPPTPPPPMPARASMPLASVRFDGEAQPERTVSHFVHDSQYVPVEQVYDVNGDPRERLNRMRHVTSPIDNVVEEELKGGDALLSVNDADKCSTELNTFVTDQQCTSAASSGAHSNEKELELIPLVEGDGTILPEEQGDGE